MIEVLAEGRWVQGADAEDEELGMEEERPELIQEGAEEGEKREERMEGAGDGVAERDRGPAEVAGETVASWEDREGKRAQRRRMAGMPSR